MTQPRISPIANPSFRTLFAAQVFSLLAIGLMTVAMSLAAYRIGGVAAAGQIVGFLLAVKMVAYVGIAPLAEALFAGRRRKRVMIGLDLGRMLLLLPMAFATQTWQIALLALVFFAVSSGFTPLFQSVIPDVLPDEKLYSRALVWSRIAYTLESVLSPIIAAMVLQLIEAEFLFWVAALAFTGSVAALFATRFPADRTGQGKGPFLRRAMKGLSIYRKTPRLRGLFLLNFALSLSMAWVLVNSVVLAGVRLGDAEGQYPILMAFYGLGAAIGAVVVPRLVESTDERRVMLGGAMMHAVAGLGIALPLGYAGYMALWMIFGLAASLVLTPGGLVIARSAGAADRPAVFAAQFSLSHAGWLLAYPLAGQLAALAGLEPALLILSGLTAGTAVLAVRVWPATDPIERLHEHPELPEGHPHFREAPSQGPRHRHAHAYHIDDLHPNWSGSTPA
ncbi:Predicted arabinose efflux permease, MFS family [Mameliella alba]|uniref:MFS transporter n=1 Tax=Mameliella alba TaxID=561184 RepID=UPI00088B6AC3|nr:MFS transporter [Mameliella alba]OWV42093.1 MFS transporter [Mameliella alba]PTR35639.1 putative MFS family arabinose efflux permease [Mameliella alba]GGF60535.1 MFS transporter [Mameliella alba]SDE16858.1 Predicted arabinose efflux permease, MFS family [Mameliella alba]